MRYLPRVRERISRVGGDLGKARRLFARTGPAGIAVRSINRFVPRRLLTLEWFLVFETWVDPAADAVPAPFRWATRGDAESLGPLHTGERVVAERLDCGDRCLVAVDAGQPMAQLFATQRPWNETGLSYHVPPGAWWMVDAYVAVPHRGRRLHVAMFREMTSRLSADGGRVRAISTIDVLNEASRRSAARRGAREIGAGLAIKTPVAYVTRQRWVGGRAEWRVHRSPRRVDIPV